MGELSNRNECGRRVKVPSLATLKPRIPFPATDPSRTYSNPLRMVRLFGLSPAYTFWRNVRWVPFTEKTLMLSLPALTAYRN
jgi:hypothetical protein